MNYSWLSEKAASDVRKIFDRFKAKQLPYHNLAHTEAVVTHVLEIAEFYQLSEKRRSVLTIAAWFHDLGQLSGSREQHEERGAAMLREHLVMLGADPDFIDLAEGCILATKMTSLPSSLEKKILCDADTYHFGTAHFRETEFWMMHEMELVKRTTFPEWHQRSLEMLKNHIFFTEYCQLTLNRGKQANIHWLESLILHSRN